MNDSVINAAVQGYNNSGVGISGYSAGTGFGVQGSSAAGISGFFQSDGSSQATLVTRQQGASTADLLQVQNAGSSPLLAVNYQGRLTVGGSSYVEVLTVGGVAALQETSAPSSTSGYGKLYVNSSDSALHFVNDSGTDTIVAPGTKKIVLPAEYAGAILDAAGDSSCTAANNGTMTSGLATGLTGFANTTMNYYKWTTNQGSPQCYDIVVQVPIPADFSAWASTTPLSIAGYFGGGTLSGVIKAQVLDSTGAVETNVNYANVTPASASTWSNVTAGSFGGTYTAGGYMTIKLRLTAATGSLATDIRVGTITLNYR